MELALLGFIVLSFYYLYHVVWGRWLLLIAAAILLYKHSLKIFTDTDKVPEEKLRSLFRDVSLIAFLYWSIFVAFWLYFLFDLTLYGSLTEVIS